MNSDTGSNKGIGISGIREPGSVAFEVMPEEGLEILPLVNLFLRHRWQILTSALWSTLLVLLVSLAIPNTYSAKVKFAVQTSSQRTIRMEASAVAPGNLTTSPVDAMPEYFEALVHGQEFLRFLINEPPQESQTQQMKSWWSAIHYNPSIPSDWEWMPVLEKAISITKGTSATARTNAPILELTVTLGGAKAAEDLAGDLLAALSRYQGDASNQKALQNREFIHARLEESERELRSAETALAEFISHNHLIATPDLENQKDRFKRAVKVEEEIYLTLRKQYEIARIDAEEEQKLIQPIDRPIAIKTGPRRTPLVLLTGFASLTLAFVFFILRDRWRRLDQKDAEVIELIQHIQSIRYDLLNLSAISLIPKINRLLSRLRKSREMD